MFASLRRDTFHFAQGVRGFSCACLWRPTFIPNLTRVLSSPLTSCPDFVLDLASNGELQSRISRMGSLSTACARYYTAQLVDALDYMHLRGVIHRCARAAPLLFSTVLIPVASDLKPENLLLDDDFRIKVTDFGTGKLIDVPRSFLLHFVDGEKPSCYRPSRTCDQDICRYRAIRLTRVARSK